MTIDDFVAGLKAAIKAGDEDKLLNQYHDFPEAEPDILEFLQAMSLMLFAGLYGKEVSVTYKPFAELPPHRKAQYEGKGFVERLEYIIYIHYADAEQETDNSAPVGRLNGAYKILI